MGQLKEEQVEIDAMKARIAKLEEEAKNAQRQYLLLQRAFLLQQRELNALQYEKTEGLLVAMNDEK